MSGELPYIHSLTNVSCHVCPSFPRLHLVPTAGTCPYVCTWRFLVYMYLPCHTPLVFRHVSRCPFVTHTLAHVFVLLMLPVSPAVFPQHVGGMAAKAPYPHVCPKELLTKIWALLGVPPASASSHSSSVCLQDSLAIRKQSHRILCRVPHIAVPLLTTMTPCM